MEPVDRLADLFTFPNFEPEPLCAINDEAASVRITLREVDRPQKVSAGRAAASYTPFTASAPAKSATSPPPDSTSPSPCRCVGSDASGAA